MHPATTGSASAGTQPCRGARRPIRWCPSRVLDQRRRGRRTWSPSSAIPGVTGRGERRHRFHSRQYLHRRQGRRRRGRGAGEAWNSDPMHRSAAAPSVVGGNLKRDPAAVRSRRHTKCLRGRLRQPGLAARLGPPLPAVWAAAGAGTGPGLGMEPGSRLPGALRPTRAGISRGCHAMRADLRDPAGALGAGRAHRHAADARAGGSAVRHRDRHPGGAVRRAGAILRRPVRQGSHAGVC